MNTYELSSILEMFLLKIYIFLVANEVNGGWSKKVESLSFILSIRKFPKIILGMKKFINSYESKREKLKILPNSAK